MKWETEATLRNLARAGKIALVPHARTDVVALEREGVRWVIQPQTGKWSRVGDVRTVGAGLFALCRDMGLDLKEVGDAMDQRGITDPR